MTAVASPVSSPAVARALGLAGRGERLEIADAEALLHADGADFERLLDLASARRDAGLAASGRPGVITYSRKVFVPLTTLCRDRCHYCVFVDTPGQLLKKSKPAFMSPEQVLAVVRQGQALGCKEALLTLGDRPEDRWPEARAWLDEHGFASTLDYVGFIARLITDETGMLAHLNPGVMTADELRMLRPTAPSMGMMLETTSRRLYEEPGQVHFGSPDKDPDVRLAVIDAAGAERVPFTTGILVGIGETVRDRAESLVALRDAHERHAVDGPAGPQGHIQEVIVQNFRAKPRTAMQDAPDADLREYVAAVAVARLVMGARMRIQVPPNLSDPGEFALLVRAGIDDWGGVSPLTADHVNPERPWPHVDDLAAQTAALGFELQERLTAHPEFVTDAATWLDPAMRAPVAALADPVTGLATRSLSPATSSGSDDASRSLSRSMSSGTGATAKLAEAAASDPLALDDAEWVALLEATGRDLDALTAVADDVRRYTVGEAITLVVNRNLTSSGFTRGVPAGAQAFGIDDVAAIAADAVGLGATEICVQGRLDPGVDAEAYLDIARTVKRAAPGIHLHAYRPQDVRDLADRGGLGLDGALAELRAAGVDTVPGTGVKVLSERVRRLVAPDDLPIDRWTEGIAAAHATGFRSTSVLFYGHVETAGERIAHLRELRRLQAAAAKTGSGGGFSEFVPIPLPGRLGGVPLVAGRSPIDEHRAMVAVSRLLLSGSIPHIQIPWTRVGRADAAVLLRSGGDDLGGTLLDGRVKPEAGIEYGQELPVADAAAIAARMFRPFRLRTTTYAEAGVNRGGALRQAQGPAAPVGQA
ncbi:FO synthase [Microbacterium terrae]|uniref:7,8-didemethyl-8-hydroxy-5-deazariboflavin synthase n=1 Tax=Microbacterium terrae TaxID=69369 RepID=A0A0M2H7K9_9MICO|nr:7,8-didemethyl-8-hydroxy-5-deazariboflavin synthase CofG [Microbacterium terrae]KJL40095.1 Aminodeoxyfutalosine synthase [Microbacterium terrae]MBP1079238.1 FO synthase [Microbacterium terrae]GLJ98638.1 FO synthase [Microbacterium terrae]